MSDSLIQNHPVIISTGNIHVILSDPLISLTLGEENDDEDVDEFDFLGSETHVKLLISYMRAWQKPTWMKVRNIWNVKIESEDPVHEMYPNNCSWFGSQSSVLTFYKPGLYEVTFEIQISGNIYSRHKHVNIVGDDEGMYGFISILST